MDERDPDDGEMTVNLKAAPDESERRRAQLLAKKLANEALKSPQLQHSMKKLADLSEPRPNLSVTMKSSPTTGLVGSAFKLPRMSSRKLNKSPKRKGTRRRMRDKRRHGLKRHKEHRPSLRKKNRVKVGKICSSVKSLREITQIAEVSERRLKDT